MNRDLAPVVDSLLALGDPGRRPAGAAVGLRVDDVCSVGSGGWALAPALAPDGVGRPMRDDTVLDLASVTKVASTTALAMVLVGSGELALDEPVVSHLPGFAGGSPDVTVRHLLSHTAGVPPWLPLYCDTTDRAEAIARAVSVDLVSEPGTVWSYSDLGMIAMGAVLEAVAGERQDALFARLVADPLGLGSTAYGPVDPGQAAASADSDVVELEMVRTGEPHPTGHTVEDFDGWRDAPTVGTANDGNAAHALGGVAGHAGLFSTVPDLLVLGRWLTDRSVHGQVLDDFTRPLPVAPDRALGFRLATWRVAGEAVPVVLHPGFTGTVLASALDRDLVLAVAATRLHTTTGSIGAPRARREDLVPVDRILETTLSGVLTT